MGSPTNLRENQRQSNIDISNKGPSGQASSTRMACFGAPDESKEPDHT